MYSAGIPPPVAIFNAWNLTIHNIQNDILPKIDKGEEKIFLFSHYMKSFFSLNTIFLDLSHYLSHWPRFLEHIVFASFWIVMTQQFWSDISSFYLKAQVSTQMWEQLPCSPKVTWLPQQHVLWNIGICTIHTVWTCLSSFQPIYLPLSTSLPLGSQKKEILC